MPEEKKFEEETEEAKFNFALASLQRIHDILKAIVENEKKVNVSLDPAQVQIIKKRLVKQLFVQAYPLLVEKDKQTIKDKVNGVKLETKKGSGMDRGVVISSLKVNEELDNCIIEIEASMQKQGKFFMPDKDEGSLL